MRYGKISWHYMGYGDLFTLKNCSELDGTWTKKQEFTKNEARSCYKVKILTEQKKI